MLEAKDSGWLSGFEERKTALLAEVDELVDELAAATERGAAAAA